MVGLGVVAVLQPMLELAQEAIGIGELLGRPAGSRPRSTATASTSSVGAPAAQHPAAADQLEEDRAMNSISRMPPRPSLMLKER